MEIDWELLKTEYKTGTKKSISGFLRLKGININGNVSRRIKGWRQERERYQIEYRRKLEIAAQDKIVNTFSEDLVAIRRKQANIGRALQGKGMKGLLKYEPENAMESLKMLMDGSRLEREALGINEKNGSEFEEPAFMKTRFAQDIKERFKDINNEQFVNMLNILGIKSL